MRSVNESITVDPSKRISNDLIDRIASAVLQRVSVVGGTATRIGTSLCIDVSRASQSAMPWVGKIMTAGPASEADTTDARYWVKEQVLSFHATTKVLTVADLTGGRWLQATNIQELGIGSSDAGTHGLLFKSGETPSRGSSLTAPSRYVLVHGVSGGYVFSTPPFVYLEDSYYYDVYGVDGDGCPDSAKWWKGVLPFCVVDYDASPP